MLVAEPENAAENIRVILPLIFDVVNGEDRANLIVPPVALILQLEIDHGEGCLPVVRMQNIRHKINVRQDVQHRLAEVGKAFAVVKMPVETAASAEILLVVHEVVDDAVVLQHPDADIQLTPAEKDGSLIYCFHFRTKTFTDCAVKRHDHADIHVLAAALLNFRGQGAEHVAETAGRGKGQRLCADKEDFSHMMTPLSM